MEIKDMLKSGKTTPEQLMKDLENQIKDAENEIAAEKKQEDQKDKSLKEARKKLVLSAMDYVKELGLIEKNPTKEEIDKIYNEIYESLESFEQALKDFQPIRSDIEKIFQNDLNYKRHYWPNILSFMFT